VCEIRPVAWLPTPEELEQLQVLLMRLAALQVRERQEANRLENSRLDAQTRQEIEAHRQDLQTDIQGCTGYLGHPVRHLTGHSTTEYRWGLERDP
jgi:hypothetical protein